MATYEMIKRLMTTQKANGTLDAPSWKKKLDVFFMCDRIKDEQYKELMSMLEAQ